MSELASCTIYVKGIPAETTEADVRTACSHYGNIAEVAIPEGKDFCFVEFAEESEAQVRPQTGDVYLGRELFGCIAYTPAEARRRDALLPRVCF